MACRPNPHTNHVHIKEPNYVDPSELRPGDKFRLEDIVILGPFVYECPNPDGSVKTDHGYWFIDNPALTSESTASRRVILVERAPEPAYKPGDLVLDNEGEIFKRIRTTNPGPSALKWIWMGAVGGPTPCGDDQLSRPLRRLRVVDEDV